MNTKGTNEAERTADPTSERLKPVPCSATGVAVFVFMTQLELGVGIVFWYKSNSIRNSCGRGGGQVANRGRRQPYGGCSGKPGRCAGSGPNQKSLRIRLTTALMRDGGFFAPAIPGGTNNRENHQ